jgi:hypothetical protein
MTDDTLDQRHDLPIAEAQRNHAVDEAVWLGNALFRHSPSLVLVDVKPSSSN